MKRLLVRELESQKWAPRVNPQDPSPVLGTNHFELEWFVPK